jgi:hypothetical protein
VGDEVVEAGLPARAKRSWLKKATAENLGDFLDEGDFLVVEASGPIFCSGAG